MYRVFLTDRGSYRAVSVGADPDLTDLSNSFECDDWQVFASELRHRLLHETSKEVLQKAAEKDGRTGKPRIPFVY